MGLTSLPSCSNLAYYAYVGNCRHEIVAHPEGMVEYQDPNDRGCDTHIEWAKDGDRADRERRERDSKPNGGDPQVDTEQHNQ